MGLVIINPYIVIMQWVCTRSGGLLLGMKAKKIEYLISDLNRKQSPRRG